MSHARFRLALLALSVLFPLFYSTQAAAAPQPLLLRQPSLSQSQIAFCYADDIWTVSRQGGDAERLTSNAAVVAGPYFSPDGSQIAYSAHLRGNTDVFVIPATGGVPRRVTWHPDGNYVAGWSPDGKDLLMSSSMASYRHFLKLFRVHADGSGIPEPLPLPSGFEGSFSPDAQSIAYQPFTKWQPAWKRYGGGQTTPIWIVNLKSLDLVKIPRENSNDSNPVWVGNEIYFLSDRNAAKGAKPNSGPVTLYRYDTSTKAVKEVVANKSFDLKSFQAGPGALVYEQFGSIHLLDTATGADKTVSIQIHGELARLAPRRVNLGPEEIQNVALSPTGARVVFEAHGDIFTVPAEKGDTRNLTQTPGVAERNPAWSPDGKTIAYFSDASGEYQLYLKDQTGFKPPTVIDLGPDPSYFYNPTWSPDSKHIAYYDKHLRLWVVDLPTPKSETKPETPAGKPVLIDTEVYGNWGPDFAPSWSPDSKWISYHRDIDNQLRAIFLYSLETKKSTQVTDGMSDAFSPSFDLNGKYLYFLASTDDGPSNAGIDLSSLDRAQTSGAYVVVLAKYGSSPIPPESDDEKIKDADKKDDAKDADTDKKDNKDTDKADKKDAAKKDDTKKEDTAKDADKDKKDSGKKDDAKPEETKIDLENIGNRILSLPIPPRNYAGLGNGKAGVLFLAETSPVGRSSADGGGGIRAIWRFTLEKRQPEAVLTDLDAFTISQDGVKVLYARHGSFTIASADDLNPGSNNPGKGLNIGNLETVIDPRAEWRQIYHETWRIERDFLYDPNHHGLSIPKIEARYKPYLDGLAARSELSYLQTEMLGEISVGHMFIRDPGHPENFAKTGLLGADFTVEHGLYRIHKILGGQNWTPGLASPLTLPGVYVHQGAYLLAVNGRELHANDNLYEFFDGTAGKQTVLHIAYNPEGKDAKDVTVVPISDEDGLRNLDWIEANRRKVTELSGGKVAYVYMPNTGGAGYTNFNRYFYAQLDKQALVLDERWNEGGFIADYVVDVLKRFPLSVAKERDGKPIHDPVGAIFGPKVMLINQNSGSGGDAMPWYFRKAGIGKLIGTRTWGGLVGIGGYPTLMDGGGVTAPRYGIYGLNNDWEVENHGIAPDIAVEDLPKDFAAGHDRQLETGVKEVLDELKAHPVPEIPVPPYPNYHKNDGLGSN